MKYRNKSSQSGFTLVEIAIVLVIIGLLLGGVLKGQEMIENAKIKNLRNDYQGIAAAYYAYKDRYNAAPGDDAAGATRWVGSPAITGGNGGNGAINGGFNAACGVASGAENCLVWNHLRLSGLIAGATSSSNPINAYGGAIAVVTQGGAAIGGASVGLNVCMTNLPAKAAAAIDSSFDDGVGNAGQVRATLGAANVAPGVAVAPYVENGTNTYTVCKVL